MRQVVWGVGLAIAVTGAGLAHGAPTAAPSACVMKELAELPLIDQGGDFAIDVGINGQPVRMIVDTGSVATMLTLPAARRLKLALRQTGVDFYGVGGKDEGLSARLHEFRVGSMTDADFDMFVSGENDFKGTVGLLGSLFLLQTDVEFDVPEGKIRFFKPVNCKGDQVVYWGQAYSVASMNRGAAEYAQIEVNVMLNGKPTAALMDTGASSSVVTIEAAAAAGVRSTTPGVVAAQALRGMGAKKVQSFAGVFSTFSFGDETIHNARLLVADLFGDDKESVMNSHIPVTVSGEERMLLGADFFRSHRVYVSRAQKKVYVSYVGGPVFHKIAPTAP